MLDNKVFVQQFMTTINDRIGVNMGMCQSLANRLSQIGKKDKQNAEVRNNTEVVITIQPNNANDHINAVSTQKATEQDLQSSDVRSVDPFNISYLVTSYGGYEKTWNELEKLYLEHCTTLGLDHSETIITLQQMCSSAWSIFSQERRTYAWESYLYILYQRFRNEDIDHALKMELLNSISKYLNSCKNTSNEILPLYDALYSNLSQILGATHELTLRALYFKGLHYYQNNRFTESWNILESVYTKQLKLKLNIDETIESMCYVAEKSLNFNNLEPFLYCMKILKSLSLGDNCALMLHILRLLSKIATENISAEAGLKVYDDVISCVWETLGQNHINTCLCLLTKAQYLISLYNLVDAWSIIENVCKVTSETLPSKPKERYIMQAIVCDLICKCQSNWEHCKTIHNHPFTPKEYDRIDK